MRGMHRMGMEGDVGSFSKGRMNRPDLGDGWDGWNGEFEFNKRRKKSQNNHGFDAGSNPYIYHIHPPF